MLVQQAANWIRYRLRHTDKTSYIFYVTNDKHADCVKLWDSIWQIQQNGNLYQLKLYIETQQQIA
jgi:hypothetical protein